jgi:hypothetical protein
MALVKKKETTNNKHKQKTLKGSVPASANNPPFLLFIYFCFIFDPLKRIERGRSLGWDNIDGPVDWKNIPV